MVDRNHLADVGARWFTIRNEVLGNNLLVLGAKGSMESLGQGKDIRDVLWEGVWEQNGWGWRAPDWKEERM